MQRWFLMGVLTFSALHGVLHAEESFQETEIKIEKEDGAEYFEHRVNGVLKEIKVVPKVGPAYYLVPADGGAWIKEERSTVLVPKWVLFEW